MTALRGAGGHVFRLIRKRSSVLFVFVPFALIEASFDGAIALSYGFITDLAIHANAESSHRLTLVVCGLVGTLVLSSIVSTLRDYLYARMVASVVNDVRRATFDHCQRLSVAFYTKHQTGELTARFSTDLAGFETWLIGAANGLLLPGLGVLVGAGLLFFLIDWHLALFSTLIWPLVLIGPRLIAPRAAAASYRKRESEAAALVTIEETLQAQRTVKAFGLQSFARQRFLTNVDSLRATSVRAGFTGALVERSTVLTIYTVQVLVVSVGAYLTLKGQIAIASLISFLTIFWNLGWSLVVIGRSAPSLVAATGSIRRIDELLDEPTDPSESGNAEVLPLRDSIRFHEVTFGYGHRHFVLLAASFEIKRGASVAFVGPSGSGKSTVLNLLIRFYDPLDGKILIDGVDVRDVSAASLRAQMGIVMQESFLFNVSIRENIRLGRLDATNEEIEAAAKAAEIHDVVVAMPDGYDTKVGERGAQLSGGQRQRVAIARALVRNPSILMLDEASSALDPASEAAINETLAKAGRGRTTLSVTHRLAAVTRADQIFVVSNNRIAEKGTHPELLKLNRVYAELWRKQQGFVVSDDGARAEVSADRLREIALLNPLGAEQLSSLASLFVCERAPAGHVIITEGEPGTLFYIIVRGVVTVTRRGKGGQSAELARLSDGDQFGEMALLYDAPRAATVTASSDCLFVTLPRQHFLALLHSTPDVRATVERVAAERSAKVKGTQLEATMH